MSAAPVRTITPEEYLAYERESSGRHEYVRGEIFAMAGASEAHNMIALNVAVALRNQLRGGPCRGYVSDMRVKIDARRSYVYPDVVVVCGERRFEDDQIDTLLNPTLVVEVLSPSTEAFDRGAKAEYYRQVPSVQEYLLVAQDRIHVEQYSRSAGGTWTLREYGLGSDSIVLASIGCELAVDHVYEEVEIGRTRNET